MLVYSHRRLQDLLHLPRAPWKARPIAVALVLLAFLLSDLARRRIPNALIIAAFLVGIAGHVLHRWPWSWGGALLGLAVLLVARYPAGDCKAACVLGGFLGVAGIAVTLGIAMGITLAAWQRGTSRVPFMVYVAVGYVVWIAGPESPLKVH